MPLARHDIFGLIIFEYVGVSTHMPLARHDVAYVFEVADGKRFYSHASCEA